MDDPAPKLPRAVRDKAGKTLRTSDDARRYVLAKLKVRPTSKTWKHAGELLIDEGSSPESVVQQIEFALLVDGELDIRFTSEQQKQ